MATLQHARVIETTVRLGIGYAEAESLMRVQAQSDAGMAAVVAKIDRDVSAHKAAARERNTRMAAKVHQLPASKLIAALAADPALFTWLCERVHLTVAHERPPGEEE